MSDIQDTMLDGPTSTAEDPNLSTIEDGNDNPPDVDDEEISVSIGGDEPEEAPADSNRLRDLREVIKEKDRRIKDLEDKVPVKKDDALGNKPELKDYDFDEEQHAAALEGWILKKQVLATKEAEKNKEVQNQLQEFTTKYQKYETEKKALKVSDFESAEEFVRNKFSLVQQGAIVDLTDKPELVVYALGKNPKKAEELAAITNPAKFIRALTLLETTLKVSTKKPSSTPDTRVVGGGGSKKDAKLEHLTKEAERTGNRTELIRYKHSLTKKGT